MKERDINERKIERDRKRKEKGTFSPGARRYGASPLLSWRAGWVQGKTSVEESGVGCPEQHSSLPCSRSGLASRSRLRPPKIVLRRFDASTNLITRLKASGFVRSSATESGRLARRCKTARSPLVPRACHQKVCDRLCDALAVRTIRGQRFPNAVQMAVQSDMPSTQLDEDAMLSSSEFRCHFVEESSGALHSKVSHREAVIPRGAAPYRGGCFVCAFAIGLLSCGCAVRKVFAEDFGELLCITRSSACCNLGLSVAQLVAFDVCMPWRPMAL